MNTIEVIARGVLIKNEHLLVCQPIGKDYIYLPGGHIEFFETAQKALLREWQEELNCSCEIVSLLSFFENCFVDSAQQKHHEYTLLYQIKCDKLQPNKFVNSNESHISFKWIALKNLSLENLLPKNIQNFLIDLTKSNNLPAI